MSTESPVLANYKPSAFYFRRAIRSARTNATAHAAAQGVILELELLHAWILERHLFNPEIPDRRAELGRCKTLRKIKDCGLAAVADLERLKAGVRDLNLIPPKWRIRPEEAADKGWGKVIPLA